MKWLRFAVLAAAVGAASVPVLAQTGLNGMDFVNAVRSRDGDKATQLIQSHPSGLVDARDGDGDTPLIAASRIGFEQGVEWLLESGAKVDLTNRMGETALIVAVQQRQVPVV